MVKAEVKNKISTHKKPKKMVLVDLKKAGVLQNVLQNTANRWAGRPKGFDGDLTMKSIAPSGKSVILAVDGKPVNSKYIISGTGKSAFFLSCRAF